MVRRTLIKAVYQYDLVQLPLEFVEMLPSFIPNDTEMKAIKVNDYRSILQFLIKMSFLFKMYFCEN